MPRSPLSLALALRTAHDPARAHPHGLGHTHTVPRLGDRWSSHRVRESRDREGGRERRRTSVGERDRE